MCVCVKTCVWPFQVSNKWEMESDKLSEVLMRAEVRWSHPYGEEAGG